MVKNKLKEIRMKEFMMAPGEFSDYLGIKLTPSMLKVSGVYELLKSQENKMTIMESEALLKKNGLSIRRNNLIPILKEINENK